MYQCIRIGTAVHHHSTRNWILAGLLSLLFPVAAVAAPDASWSTGDYSLIKADCITPTSDAGGPLVPEYYFPDGVTPCHDYTIDTVERPMISSPQSSKSDDYFSDLDIEFAYVGEDDDWLYMGIELIGFGKDGFKEGYSFEIDYGVDAFGRADMLVWAPDASKTSAIGSWTTDSIEVYRDDDDSVGSTTPTAPDNTNGDGFNADACKDDTCGEKAYWRRTSSGTPMIEFAVKKTWLATMMVADGGSGPFVMNDSWYRAWSMKGIKDKGNFYFHDQYSNEEYGSPYQIGYAGQTNPPTLCLVYTDYECATNPLFPGQNVYEQDNSGGIGSWTGDDTQLTLVKVVNNSYGGNDAISSFDLNLQGNDGTHNSGVDYQDPDGNGVQPTVISGVAYTLTEGSHDGYTFSDLDCEDDDNSDPVGSGDTSGWTLTLDPDQHVTCTFTNIDEQPTLTLTKFVNGGIAGPNEFGISVGGSGVTSGVPNGYNANTPLAISETGLAGYVFSSITGDAKCPAGLGGTVTLDEGESVSCTITNNAIPSGVLNLSKVVASGPTWSTATNRFTVVYTVTATNDGDSQGTYNLVDTLTPGAGLAVHSAELTAYIAGTDSRSTVTPSLPHSFSSGATLVTGETIGAGNQESWTVTVEYTIDLSQADDSTVQCTDAGNGFYNYVGGIDGEENTDDNDACVPPELPGINLSKIVTNVTPLDADTYQVIYTVAAINEGASQGLYDLYDNLLPGDGITLVSAKLSNYIAGTEDSQTGTLTGAMPYDFTSGLPTAALVTNETLAAGKTEAWRITAVFDVDWDYGQGAELECGEVEFGEGTGFYNFVSGAVGENTDDNHACGEPGSPSLSVTKEAGAPVSNDDDTYDVTYTINVANTGTGPGFYNLVDTLMVDDSLTLLSIVEGMTYDSLASNDTWIPAQSGTIETVDEDDLKAGATTLVSGESIGGLSDETWTITLRFTLNPDLLTDEGANCTFESEETGTGFSNHIELFVGETEIDEDDGCVPIPQSNFITFIVTKDFSDNNEAGATVRMECNGGYPHSETTQLVDPTSPGFFKQQTWHVFNHVVGETDCRIFEDPVPGGYADSYSAAAGDDGIAGDIDDDNEELSGCLFIDITSGTFTCHVSNTLQPHSMIVNKEWFWDKETHGDDLELMAKAYWECFNTRDGSHGDLVDSITGRLIFDADSEVEEDDSESDGDDDSASEVIEPIYPDWDGSTYCTVNEHSPESHIEADDSDCEEVAIPMGGEPPSCTIYNTIFFHEIPTLSTYGLALLTLLMMGVGFMVMRRQG